MDARCKTQRAQRAKKARAAGGPGLLTRRPKWAKIIPPPPVELQALYFSQGYSNVMEKRQ